MCIFSEKEQTQVKGLLCPCALHWGIACWTLLCIHSALFASEPLCRWFQARLCLWWTNCFEPVCNMIHNSQGRFRESGWSTTHSLSHGEEIVGPSPRSRVKRQKLANLVHHACMLVCLALACGRSAAETTESFILCQCHSPWSQSFRLSMSSRTIGRWRATWLSRRTLVSLERPSHFGLERVFGQLLALLRSQLLQCWMTLPSTVHHHHHHHHENLFWDQLLGLILSCKNYLRTWGWVLFV